MENNLSKRDGRRESLVPKNSIESIPVTAIQRFLLLLLMVRLLLPPGICLCHDNSPASRLILDLLNPDRPQSSTSCEEDEDHDPGCPGSPLATGMGLKLPLVAVFPPLPNTVLDMPGLVLPAPAFFWSAPPTWGLSPPIPIYLEDCSLLI